MRGYCLKRRAGVLMLVVILFMTGSGLADAVLEEKTLALGESRIAWPQAAGLGNAELEERVNRTIVEEGRITDWLARMSQLISDGWIRTDWQGTITGNLLSVSLLTEGMVETRRESSVWTAVNLDLTDGAPFSWRQLFRDPQEAETALAARLEEIAASDLSAMLLSSAVTPLPELFRMDREGLTFLYPADQLCTLHDRAGDIHLAWCEIRDLLNLDEGAPADRLGVPEEISLTEAGVSRIRTMTENGCLPGIPVKVGDPLSPLVEKWHLATDPDVYEGGRLFSLEGGCFRRIFLMTDYLSEDWDQSIVQGIRADRGNYAGLCIGETKASAWRDLLGEPDSSLLIDEDKAELNRTEPGSCDYYSWGSYQLRLQCNKEETLISILLTELE